MKDKETTRKYNGRKGSKKQTDVREKKKIKRQNKQNIENMEE